MIPILFATRNIGKLREARKIAKAFDFAIFDPWQFGLSVETDENGETFEENALIKLRQYLSAIEDTELWVLSDDGGVTIDALGGEPGVHSRRWAGHEMTDAEIIHYCLDHLSGVPLPERTAKLRIAMALARKGQEPLVVTEEEQGLLLEEPDTSVDITDLPFRALFYLPQYDALLAHLHSLPLNERPGFFTHRERALIKIFERIRQAEN